MYPFVDFEQEADSCCLAEVAGLPGVLANSTTELEAVACAQAPALRVLADRRENGEPAPESAALELSRREMAKRVTHDEWHRTEARRVLGGADLHWLNREGRGRVA